MLIIRLQRVGKKNQPSYRIVLAENTAPVKGKFIEILGNYNPRLKTKAFKKDRILFWLSKGAKASPTVHNLLVSEQIVAGPKVKAWTPKRKEGEKMGAGVKIEKIEIEKMADDRSASGHPEGEKPAEESASVDEEKPVEAKKVEEPKAE
jgi:small subunit ribosomal protein S16